MYAVKICVATALIVYCVYHAVPLYDEIMTNISLGNKFSVFVYDSENGKLFTEEELSKYIGENDIIYLSILGKVFDVSEGASHYGPGKTYHHFAGRDGSCAFITGDYSERGLTGDVLTLSSQEIIALMNWLKFYQEKYPYIGKLIGKYYDHSGGPTFYSKAVEDKFSQAKLEKKSEYLVMEKYPPCNVEYKPQVGSTVWCSRKSGGISRDWIGLPRKLYLPGAKSSRCACVNIEINKNEDMALLEEYNNCESTSTTCIVKD